MTGPCDLCELAESECFACGRAVPPEARPQRVPHPPEVRPQVAAPPRASEPLLERAGAPLVGEAQRAQLEEALARDSAYHDAETLQESARVERELLGYARAIESEIQRRSLYHFLLAGWQVLEPGGPVEENWHLRATCDEVQAMLEGWLVAKGHADEVMRAAVVARWAAVGLEYQEGRVLAQNWIGNLPPGTLKSRILMVYAPAWMWLWCPMWSLCAISSVDDNVKRDSQAHRDLVTSAWYREMFAVAWTTVDDPQAEEWDDPEERELALKIRGDVSSVQDWMTSVGGRRKSRTILGGYTGIHVDALFLDDPDDAERVHNESDRRRVQSKWTKAIRNRLNNLAIDLRMAIQQRVHVDDWTAAQLLKSRWSPSCRTGWVQFCLPLRYGYGPKDLPERTPHGFRDPRTREGEVLHPARFSDEVIADELNDKGAAGFAAQYDQNPETLDGGMFARDRWRFFVLEGEPAGEAPRPEGCVARADSPPLEIRRKAGGAGGFDLESVDLTIDCSFGTVDAKTSSEVGLLCCGKRGQVRFVIDDRTELMTFPRTVDAIVRMLRECPPAKELLVEVKANGNAVIQSLEQLLQEGVLLEDGRREPIRWRDGRIARCVLVECNPEGGKRARAVAMQPEQEARLVYLREGAPWLRKFVDQVSGFPQVKRDDRVDALSQWMAHHNEHSAAKKRARALNKW